MSEKEDTYHDTILDLEAKLKKNVDLILKLGNSLQGMFMLGPKPLSVYDQQLKHGLGYPNPYTLKQAISKCPKLYVASSLGNLEIPLNVRDSEDTLEDAFKSQQKMNEKMNDPIAVANKQNCWTINYKQLNALYEDFVPQKELSVEQKYFSSSSIPSVKIPVSKDMPSESPLIKELDKIKGMNATSRVRRPMSKDSHVTHNVLDNSKKAEKNVVVYVRKNKTFSPNSRQPKSLETTFVAPKTRFSEKKTQSKTRDTTFVVSKSKIDVKSVSKAKDKVVQIVLWVIDSYCSKHMTGDRSLLRNFIKKFMGTVRFGNDNFTAITGYGDYIHGNITIFHVYYVEGLGHNLFSVGQFCDRDLEVAFRSNTCYVRNLKGDDLLTGGRDSNLYTISNSDMAASSPVCLMSKATSTKS
ncbi:hypothetical protein Tco_0855149, partial [Tanacetum coccineum]